MPQEKSSGEYNRSPFAVSLWEVTREKEEYEEPQWLAYSERFTSVMAEPPW